MEFPRRLIDGYRDFIAGRLPAEQARFRELAAKGQAPEIMVIGCADSRVSPEVIFDARPGELFVVRNVANLVPPYSPDGAYHGVSAALEFAVLALEVKHIVVLAHGRCGGVRAFAERAAPLSSGDFIGNWISLLAPVAAALERREGEAFDAYLRRLEQASAVRTLDTLMSFPYVRARVEHGVLVLHAGFFDVATGLLSVLDPATGEFASVAGAAHARVFDQPRF
jgi:carbonic anhydrase